MGIPHFWGEADVKVQATASIDIETAVHIQQVLRDELKESTIITIAHRLEAVSNANYQIVLRDGRVASQGPTKLEATDGRNGGRRDIASD